MQFRRTAVAVAIAGIAASVPQIASADTVLSGAIGIEIGADDADTPLDDEGEPLEEGEDNGDGPTSSDGRFALDEAVIGIVATHQMNNGLNAYGSVRFDGDGFSGSSVTDDNIYLGIRGAFGDIRVGEVPVGVEYGQVANDIFAVNGGSNAGISYTGSFGPATVGVNYSPARNEDQIGIGARFNVGGFAVGVGAQDIDERIEYTVGASFGFLGASVAAHFAALEVDEDGVDDTQIIGVRVGYGIAGISTSVTYMVQTADGGDGFEETVLRLDAGYGLGGGFNVSGRITAEDDDNDDDLLTYRFLMSKSF